MQRGIVSEATEHRGSRFLTPAARPALGSVLLLMGCVVGPDFVAPRAPVAETWSAVASEAVSDASAVGDAWWEGFDDAVLNTLIGAAHRDNPSLHVAAIRVVEARARLGLVRGRRAPQHQELGARAVRVELSENAPNAALGDPSFWDYQLGFDAAWELDFWGRFRRGVEAASAGYLATIAGYDEALVSVTAEVARAYVLLRTFEERLSVARRNVDVQRGSLRIADIRFRNGLVPELDVTQARALLRDTEALIPMLETGVLESRHAISTLIGRPPGDLSDLLGPRLPDLTGTGDSLFETGIPLPPADIAVGAPVDLLRRRPDVRRAELEAAAQSARIGVAQADLYPRFALIGSIGLASSGSGGPQSGEAQLGDLLDSSSITYRVGPVFSWPILNYGRLRNNIRIQDARYQQLVIAYQSAVLNAAREVEDALAAFLRSQIRVHHLGQSVADARLSVELALTRYRAGLVNYQRVLDSQLFLVLQEDRLATTRGSVALDLIATYKALGGGWQIRQGRPSLPADIEQEMHSRTNWGQLLRSSPVDQGEERP